MLPKIKDREFEAPEPGKISQDVQLAHRYPVMIMGTKGCSELT
jgi:hypothetical protein